MEKTDKPLTRDALVSMQVIDAKGRLVGKVKDRRFRRWKDGHRIDSGKRGWRDSKRRMGRSSSSSRLHNPKAAASGQKAYQPSSNPFKPQLSQPKQQSTQPLCPTCGQTLNMDSAIPKMVLLQRQKIRLSSRKYHQLHLFIF